MTLPKDDASVLTARRDALEALRGHRVRRDRARSVGDDCARLMSTLTRVSAEFEHAQRAWDAAAPGELRPLAWVRASRRGRVELGVCDASARHRVERWLRAGGLDAMRDIAGGPIASVRTRLDQR